jgi:hypothetical protein
VVDRIEIEDTPRGAPLDALKGSVGDAVTEKGDDGGLGMGIDGGFEIMDQAHGKAPFGGIPTVYHIGWDLSILKFPPPEKFTYSPCIFSLYMV